MSTIKSIFKPAGVIVGAVMVIAGYVSTGREIISWGLPIWAWQGIGATIFFVSIIAIIYSHHKKIESLSSTKATIVHSKDKKIEKPESLIFPYMKGIDAYQLQSGINIISFTYCFPSALSYDLTFIKAKCVLVINNISTDEKDISPLIIKKQTNNSLYLQMTLGEKILSQSQIKEKIKNKIAMRYKLEVKCWDNDFKEYNLNTEEQEMIALI